MGRRRKSGAEELLTALARMPWWLGVALAVASYLFLREIAVQDVPKVDNVAAIGPMAAQSLFVELAKPGQWLLPGILLAGALLSVLKRARARGLLRLAAADTALPITWRELEALVGELYRQQGYRVAETPEGGDGGVDLVLRKDGALFLVQCKHWQAKQVGVTVVRELKGVVAARQATGGAVATTGEFTHEAAAFAQEARIDLIDGARLRALARTFAPKRNAVEERTAAGAALPVDRPVDVAPPCPQCSSAMVLRTAKRGKNAGQRFWGCSAYPRCVGTRPVSA